MEIQHLGPEKEKRENRREEIIKETVQRQLLLILKTCLLVERDTKFPQL